MAILTLTTDFGTADWYVAAVKGVVLTRVPQATLVDLTHQIAPGDVSGAAFQLRAAAPTFPPGTVHLAVVDPGVGSRRRMLAVAADEQILVAPDNGLLTPFLEAATEIRAIERPDLYRDAPGATFHGRDRFAPVVAALLAGDPLATLGPRVDDAARLGGEPPHRGTADAAVMRGRVIHVDRFGNLITDIPSDWVSSAAALVAAVDGHHAVRLVTHYAELPAGEPGVLPGSLGTLELSLPGASLAGTWNVDRGAEVTVRLTPR